MSCLESRDCASIGDVGVQGLWGTVLQYYLQTYVTVLGVIRTRGAIR